MTCFKAISILMGDLIIEENLQAFLDNYTKHQSVETVAIGESITASISLNCII